MTTHDGRPDFFLDRADVDDSVVRVHPSALGPSIVLSVSDPGQPYGPLRDLSPEEARAVAAALVESAALVEAGTFRPWDDPSRRAPRP